MDAELRQVANGFDNKVRVFEKYDINGYRFRTVDKEQKMADRKTTNSGVSAIGDGGIEYYGRVEAIYDFYSMVRILPRSLSSNVIGFSRRGLDGLMNMYV